MRNRSEIFYALENSIEAIVARSGTDRERALQALCEIQLFKTGDFTDHPESMFFEQIQKYEKELHAKTISSEDLRRLFANIWELYKSVNKGRDPAQ